MMNNTPVLKPLVKWAGGKSQLIEEISSRFPVDFGGRINKYAEPFLGGGAVLLYVLSHYRLKQIYVSDLNQELINVYRTARDRVGALIDLLAAYQEEYLPADHEGRTEIYLEKRARFNELKTNGVSGESAESAALFIFLNRTCFNGLYRVNAKGLFNVPMGRYKSPIICNRENLTAVSEALQNVRIEHADYRESYDFIDDNTLVYFDPPYRPLTATANFTSYTDTEFNDSSQIQLADYVQRLEQKGASVILSNSDPKNGNINDTFFDDLYANQNIERVYATRNINSKGSQRGKITEILVTSKGMKYEQKGFQQLAVGFSR